MRIAKFILGLLIIGVCLGCAFESHLKNNSKEKNPIHVFYEKGLVII